MQVNVSQVLRMHEVVWFYPGGIASILSLAQVKEMIQMTFDSLEANQFVVQKGDDSDQVFAESHHNDTGFIFNMNAGIVNNNYKFSS